MVTSIEGPLTDTDVYTIYHVTRAKTHENSGQGYVGLLQFCYCIGVNFLLFPGEYKKQEGLKISISHIL